jgi:RNA polymerase sigma-70 factor (ECF subfamily)
MPKGDGMPGRDPRLRLLPDESPTRATGEQATGDQATGQQPTGEQAAAEQAEHLADLLSQVAGGDMAAFETLYDAVVPRVAGLVQRVLRDPAQSDEVTQEVLVEVWRTAPRFDPSRGTAAAWILTIAHRRAVDRVRSAQAALERDARVAQRDYRVAYDDVSEQVERRLEAREVRACLDSLSELQRESLQLAYYGGHSYPEVAQLLSVPLGTVKTRLRDGLLRMRACMGTP